MRGALRAGRILIHRRDAESAEGNFLSFRKISRTSNETTRATRSRIRPWIFSPSSAPRLGKALRSGHLAQCLLEQLSNFVIAGRVGNNLVPFQNAPGVSVHNKGRVIAGIQQNRVSGLGPHTIEREQFAAEFAGWPREHPRQRTSITLVEKGHKRFQALRFLPEVARGANQLLK